MAGFEVIVRPAILPNIRPRPKQSLPPQDDPEKGFAVIKGNPASSAGLSSSSSISISYSRPTETERRVDEVRVYQENDDGTVNKDNFIDMEVANRITMNEGGGGGGGGGGGDGGGGGGGSGPVPESNPHTFQDRIYFYQKVQEANNIEIKNRDVIKKNPDISQ